MHKVQTQWEVGADPGKVEGGEVGCSSMYLGKERGEGGKCLSACLGVVLWFGVCSQGL